MCTWNSIWPEVVKGLPAAFVALVVAAIAAHIAWRQYMVARAKLNLDLFEKRVELYDIVWSFLSSYDDPNNAKPTNTFVNSIPKLYFLFGTEIGDFANEARQHAAQYHSGNSKVSHAPHLSEAWEEGRAQVTKADGFIRDARNGLRGRFSKYMDFAAWH